MKKTSELIAFLKSSAEKINGINDTMDFLLDKKLGKIGERAKARATIKNLSLELKSGLVELTKGLRKSKI